MNIDPSKVIDQLRDIIGGLTVENTVLRIANRELEDELKAIHESQAQASEPVESISPDVDREASKARHPSSGTDPHPVL